MNTWTELRELRQAGQKPAFPLVITTHYPRCIPQAAAGCMVIVQESGKPLPVELLEGLDVVIDFEDCAQATAVANLVRKHQVTPASFRVWCECEQVLASQWNHDCQAGAELIAAWEKMCQLRRAQPKA
jgi:hypothetical protein